MSAPSSIEVKIPAGEWRPSDMVQIGPDGKQSKYGAYNELRITHTPEYKAQMRKYKPYCCCGCWSLTGSMIAGGAGASAFSLATSNNYSHWYGVAAVGGSLALGILSLTMFKCLPKFDPITDEFGFSYEPFKRYQSQCVCGIGMYLPLPIIATIVVVALVILNNYS